MSKKVRNIIGLRYGKLVVVSFYGIKNGVAYWTCQCDCGEQIVTSSHCLQQGNTKSCGCLHTKQSSELCKNRNYRHGYSKEPLYFVWKAMRQRCNNPRQHDYRWYGAKGIRVCEEWEDYCVFREWALKNGYSPSLTIDRIDGEKDYCPSNCRFITIQEQQKNKANSKGGV